MSKTIKPNNDPSLNIVDYDEKDILVNRDNTKLPLTQNNNFNVDESLNTDKRDYYATEDTTANESTERSLTKEVMDAGYDNHVDQEHAFAEGRKKIKQLMEEELKRKIEIPQRQSASEADKILREEYRKNEEQAKQLDEEIVKLQERQNDYVQEVKTLEEERNDVMEEVTQQNQEIIIRINNRGWFNWLSNIDLNQLIMYGVTTAALGSLVYLIIKYLRTNTTPTGTNPPTVNTTAGLAASRIIVNYYASITNI